MKVSQYLLATRRETPKDAEIVSHQLMYRAGMIKKLASGIYVWLPTGLRVARKIEQIVREEMNKAGSIELLMPLQQFQSLWEECSCFEASPHESIYQGRESIELRMPFQSSRNEAE